MSAQNDATRPPPPPGGGGDDLLTVQEAAAMMRVSARQVYRLIWDGDLAALRVGRQYRIRRGDIHHYMHHNHEERRKRRRRPPPGALALVAAAVLAAWWPHILCDFLPCHHDHAQQTARQHPQAGGVVRAEVSPIRQHHHHGDGHGPGASNVGQPTFPLEVPGHNWENLGVIEAEYHVSAGQRG